MRSLFDILASAEVLRCHLGPEAARTHAAARAARLRASGFKGAAFTWELIRAALDILDAAPPDWWAGWFSGTPDDTASPRD